MPVSAKPKKATNISLDAEMVREAKELGINLSRAAEAGLREALAHEKSDLWKRENAKALESSNEWVEEHRLPLEKYRQF